MKTVSRWLAMAALSLFSLNALAESATVSANAVKFESMIVYIETGEQVSWENMTGHNVETIDVLTPEGSEKINSELGASVTATFDTPGLYVYKCTPHWGARMGGVIMVGPMDDAMALAEQYLEIVTTEKGELLPAKGLLKKFIKDLESKG